MSAKSMGLTVEGLTRRFGGRTVVSDVSLSIAPGHVTCLLGPSGCGKSTTLRMIAGVETPDRGSVSLNGTVLSDAVKHVAPERRGIGLMFQDFALFPHLNVEDNVSFGLSGSKSENSKRVSSLLERVQLSDFAKVFPHELSGGEQQRVALTRAMAPNPRVMLMDEPFSGLDNRLRDGIRDETLEILKEEDTAVLLVTHEPGEAMRMADEIALMRDGSIIQRGAPYTVYNQPVDKAAAAFFSDINVINGVVRGVVAETEFGDFLTPDLDEGTAVDIVIRPQHVRIDFDRDGNGPHPTKVDGTPVRGEVVRSRYLGHESLVEFRMHHDNSVLKATVSSVFLPKPGTVLWLMMRRGRCHVFPSSERSR